MSNNRGVEFQSLLSPNLRGNFHRRSMD